MRPTTVAKRVGYGLASLALASLVSACGSSTKYLSVTTFQSEGLLTGRVYTVDGLAAAGVQVLAQPASLTTPSTVSTGADGAFDLRSLPGTPLIVVGDVRTSAVSRKASILANTTTTLAPVVLQKRLGGVTAGNQPPSIAAAAVSPATTTAGTNVTVVATVSDSDTAAADLQVYAYGAWANGSLLGPVALSLNGTSYSGSLTIPATATGTASVTVIATDSPGSNQTIEQSAGTLTITPAG